MKRFFYILQNLFSMFMIFIFVFTWLRFIFSSIWISLLVSLSITISLKVISIYFKRKNKNKYSLKLKEKEDAENMFLSLLTNKNYLSFFYELALSRHKNSRQKKEYILIQNNQNCTVVLTPFIKLATLTPDDIIKICQSCEQDKPSKIVITCNDYEKSCNTFIKNLSPQILIIDKFETYALLYKEYDFYPQITIATNKTTKLKVKDLLSSAFNKTKTKGYLLSALVVFASSYFMKNNIYYCIVGSLLLIFALISFKHPKFNLKKEKTIL